MDLISRRQFSKSLIASTAALSISGSRLSLASAIAPDSRSSDALAGLTLVEAARQVRSGAVTSVALTQACLDRIRIYNPILDAYITVMGEYALALAAQMDVEQKANKFRGPLHGVPIALKDNIDTAGIRTTAGSKVFDDRVPTEDAEVVRRLSAAGAVIIGKANLDEFAFGISYFGSIRNPWALDRDPNGSSSGSAVAVAMNLAFGALGTDTGGSIRLPAAYAGVVGLKPTFGLVPIRGIVPLAFSLDHCGPITRTVEDAALMLNQLAGYDRLDISSVDHPKEDYVAALAQPVSQINLGIPRAPYFDHADADTLQAVEAAIVVLSKLTKQTKDVSLPSISTYTWLNLNNIGNEIYAYHEDLFSTQKSRYSLATRLAIQDLKDEMNSSTTTASAQVSAYIRHRWDMELLRRTIDDVFVGFDLVVLPTLRVMPNKLKFVIDTLESTAPHSPGVMELDNCTVFNVFGLPAISIPCGFSHDGLPVGLTIAGPHFSEGKIMALARAYEQTTRWETYRPPLKPNTPVPSL